MSEEMQNGGFENCVQNETENFSENIGSCGTQSDDVPQGDPRFVAPEPMNPENSVGEMPEGENSVFFNSENVVYVPFSPVLPYGINENLYKERAEVKKAARRCCLPAIIVFGISISIGFILTFVLLACGIPYNKIVDILSNGVILQGIDVLISMLMFLIPYSIIVKTARMRVSDIIPFKKPKKGFWAPMFMLGFGFCMLANVVTSYLSAVFESFGFNYSMPESELPQGIFGFLLVVISTAIIPGLVEEFAFRGVVFGFLRKLGSGFAIVISSLLFGLMHGNFRQIIFALLTGLVLGFIREKTDSLWICCAVHAANNLVSVVMSYINLSVLEENFIIIMIFCFAMLGGIIGISLIGNKTDIFKLEGCECESTVSQRYRWFFTSAWFIVMSSLFLLEAFLLLL